MGSPYRTKFIGRWCFGYWHGWRFWVWIPRRQAAWSGKVVTWRWLCFAVSLDRRTDVLGDLMYGVKGNEERRRQGGDDE